MKIKKSKGEIIFQVFNYLFFVLLMFVCLYPLWHVFVASISDPYEYMKHSGLLLFPLKFNTIAYERVFNNKLIWGAYLNTIELLAVSLTVNLGATLLGAYFFAQKGLILRRPLMILVTFTMFFSGGMIPQYLNIREFGLYDSVWGLVLPFAINTYNLIILRTSIESLPPGLMEAAKIDGAGHMRILLNIVLPLSKAPIAVNALYYGVGTWNSWFWPTLLLKKRSDYPLQAILQQILVENTMDAMDSGMPSPETIIYATIIVATVPILCIYPFIQKYFTKGVMIGAIKE